MEMTLFPTAVVRGPVFFFQMVGGWGHRGIALARGPVGHLPQMIPCVMLTRLSTTHRQQEGVKIAKREDSSAVSTNIFSCMHVPEVYV